MRIYTPATPIVIRPVANDEREIYAVAAMQCRAYRRQFFDPKGPLNGALGKAFPVLEKYENEACFIQTWKKLALMMMTPNPKGYAYVMFLNLPGNNQKPIGIIKSGSWQAGEDMSDQIRPYCANDTDLKCVAELGSIYVDPDWQGLGIGAKLTGYMAEEAMERGFTRMITRAYAQNTSPRFFINKMGGTKAGTCRIPYSYDEALLEAQGLSRQDMPDSIPGVWMIWPPMNLDFCSLAGRMGTRQTLPSRLIQGTIKYPLPIFGEPTP